MAFSFKDWFSRKSFIRRKFIMKIHLQFFAQAALGALLLAAGSLFAADIDQLQSSFAQPPDDARIMVRWWWFGPAVTKPELEREMNVMKQGGIGGFDVEPTYPLALDGELPGLKNLKLMSPEHLEALRFTAEKAKELGLRMDLTLGSGWPYGGPQFSRSEGASALRASAPVTVAAGQTSVAVPAGGGRGSGDNGEIVAALLGPVASAAAGESAYVPLEINGRMAQLPSDLRGATRVTFYTIGTAGLVQVKRPAFGGEGNIIDHYSPTVIEKFIKEIAEPEILACGTNPPYAIFCDSLEVNGENWTPNLLAEFQKRRGYDLKPLLPALFGDLGPKTLDIRHDWGQTVTEIFNNYFITSFKKLANDNHSKFTIQGYGTPPAALYSYAYADIAEGEQYTWKSFSATRWAASANHLLGRPVTSSETFTWLHSPVFRATPLDMKAEADLHFLCGVNQIICHGWPYTAEGASYPGWSFYAAAVFDEKNPWWIVMPDVTKYLQRMSYILRQGTPANDVALFLPNSDAWASFGRNFSMNAALQGKAAGPVKAITDAGYNLDFFDDQLLAMRGAVSGNTLAFGDVHYRAVVLPDVERVPVATMLVLEKFAKAGGIVIATRRLPDLAPGYLATDADTQTVRDIAQRLFKDANAPGIFIADENQLSAALAKKLAPDVAMTPAAPDIGIVHHHTDDGEIYFVANTSNQPRNVQAAFRVEGMQPEIWNAMDGSVSPATIAEKSAGSTTVNLKLEPYASTIVAFTKRSLPAPKGFIFNGELPEPIDLSSGWTVRFGTNAQPIAMDTLASWTTLTNEVNFSGVATYEKTVTVEPGMLNDALSINFDFGRGTPAQERGGQGYHADLTAPVREAAIIYINDQRVGSVWCPPYSLDVTGKLKAGENKIRIEVANLAVNYMAGIKLPNYNYAGVTDTYGNRFQPQNLNLIQPLPSGLRGPVRLVASVSSSR
jgi:alpha-L-rhamnosidase